VIDQQRATGGPRLEGLRAQALLDGFDPGLEVGV
jgi:hypothetical protein